MTKETYELQRADSLCPKPEEELLEFVRNNKSDKIRNIIECNPDLLNFVYNEYHKNIIQIACSNFAKVVKEETIETLIKLKPDLYFHSPVFGEKETLHFATLSDNYQILEIVAKNIKQTEPHKINAVTTDGDSALLVLIKEGDKNSKNFIRCAKILIEYGIDINKADGNDISPVLHAARKGMRDMVALLVEQENIDLDSHVSRQKTARDLIAEKKLYTGQLPLPINNNLSNEDELFKLLKNGEEDLFIQQGNINECLNKDDGSETFLQICSRLNLVKVTEYLVENGVDTNRITDKTKETPLQIASKRGYFEIVNILLGDDQIVLGDVLSDLLKYIDQPEVEGSSHRKCFEILLNKKELDESYLNKKDPNESTPLHYAAKYSDSDTTLLLLNKGASLGNSNKLGYLPIENIDVDTLKKHFDNCVTSNEKSNSKDSYEYTVTFSYKTLMPTPKTYQTTSESNVENGIEATDFTLLQQNSEDLVSEMNVISYMASNNELKQLIKHPLITSFLYLKWHRIRYFFYINLALYITTWASLTPHIFMSYNDPEYDTKTDVFKTFAKIFYVIVWIVFIILLLKELFQMFVSPKTYFVQVENFIEIVLIISVAMILFQKSPSDNTRKQVSAIAILVSAFQLVLLIGQHPKMSTSIVMLRTVSYNFFKFFLWHSILILAFALSFYTLFNDNSSQENNDITNSTTEEDDDFDDPGVSLFKTFVMLTGEFDASDINFNAFPITSRILFVMFIFMIAIVLLNLLNGLAVSDTTVIKNDAELFAYTSRIQHICYIENMLLGNMFPKKITQFLERFICCFPDTQFKCMLPLGLSKYARLFSNYLKNYELIVYLNKDGKVKIDSNIVNKNIFLDKKTIKNVQYLLKERYREERNDQQNITQKLLHIMKQIESLQVQQQELLKIIQTR